jgi:O-antigen ligase
MMESMVRQIPDNVNTRSIGFILGLTALFLNQSGIMFGVNLSAADFFCLLGIIILVLTKKLIISKVSLLYFMALTNHALLVSFFYVPAAFAFFPQPSSVMINYIKLLVCFCYYVLGYNTGLLNCDGMIIKSYSYAALFIGILGAWAAVTNLQPLSSILMYEGVRLTGLMNDPNYFSLIQASALVYFSRSEDVKGLLRLGICIFIVLAVLASGSKTGLITIMAYMLLRLAETFLKSRMRTGFLIRVILFSVIIAAFGMLSIPSQIFYYLSDRLPAFNRLTIIFTDFRGAVSGMGSGRDITWIVAVGLIKLSPITGIGLGTYSGLAEAFFKTDMIAHNTYLQLYAEWGMLFATLLYVYIFYITGRGIFLMSSKGNARLLADILIVFLIGSLGISLNNARMFWFLFGILSAILKANMRHCFKENADV